MWQAEYIASRLGQIGVESVLVPLVSRGDVDMRPIDGSRSVGMFTKRIQQALVDQEADIAVHSLKDLPTEATLHFQLAAVTEREVVHDSLVSPDAWSLGDLPEGARIGTGSRRRAAQLLIARKDLQILPIRGNVQTRLKKLADNEYDAIVLAEAGLLRLQMSETPRTTLSLEMMLPAPGQGALGIEVRSDDKAAAEIVGTLDDAPTRAAVTAERTLLASLHGGCLAPIAAYARVENEKLIMNALVAATDGSEQIVVEGEVAYRNDEPLDCGQQLGQQLAEQMIGQGARELIQQSR
tara:strand:- start:480 stop:1364 length:885 start_codon:yes stop_codon:yes gene_type:complete